MQEEQRVTEFSGVAGRVLQKSVSLGSLGSGLAMALVLFIGNWALLLGGGARLMPPFTQVVIALALARFAVNGLYGEWGGSVFSTAGGPWGKVGLVAMRYLVLSAIWVIPMMILDSGVSDGGPVNPMMMGAMMRGMLGVGAFYLLAATITPPVFLILSVSSDSFAELFSPQSWKQMFDGRLGDLFTVYVTYTGALMMVLMLGAPPVMLAFAANAKLGIFFTVLGFALLFGVSINLLGRLCGFFACGDLGLGQSAGQKQRLPAPAETPRPETPQPETAKPAVAAVPLAVTNAATGLAHPAASSIASASARRTALLDAKQRVDAAMTRFTSDPAGAIEGLRNLDREFTPHPLVRHALAIALHRSGEVERALETAESALPFCMERGHTLLAVQLFKEMKLKVDRLELDRDHLLALGGALVQSEDWAAAAKVYSAVLRIDAANSRAVRGLLQVAEGILARKHNPEAAARIYRFLVKNCPDSPLSDCIRQGLEEAERRLGEITQPLPTPR